MKVDMAKRKVTVVHNVPGKKGKQEYRQFDSMEEALAYTARNTKGGRFPGRLEKGKVKEERYRYK